jgi:hypothetical protein
MTMYLMTSRYDTVARRQTQKTRDEGATARRLADTHHYSSAVPSQRLHSRSVCNSSARSTPSSPYRSS